MTTPRNVRGAEAVPNQLEGTADDRGGPFDWLPSTVLASIPSVMSDGVVVVDSHGMILQLNPVFARLCGREPCELEGAPLDLVVENAPVLLGRVGELLATGESWVGRTTVRRRDGAFVECHTWLRVAMTESGPVLVCVQHDVGVRRRYGTTEIDDIAARIHELVNSLAGIRGYVDLLGSTSRDEQDAIRARLESVAVSTGERLEGLLTELAGRSSALG